MTSLAWQLERLKVPGAHSRLGHDTQRTSLIFDPKEAANEDRLSVYHMGMELQCWLYLSHHWQTVIHYNIQYSGIVIVRETKVLCV